MPDVLRQSPFDVAEVEQFLDSMHVMGGYLYTVNIPCQHVFHARRRIFRNMFFWNCVRRPGCTRWLVDTSANRRMWVPQLFLAVLVSMVMAAR